MLNDFLRNFTRAWARGLGYQASRYTGWFLVPVLIVIIVAAMLGELGQVRDVWEWIQRAL